MTEPTTTAAIDGKVVPETAEPDENFAIVSAPQPGPRDHRSLAERIGARDGKLSMIAIAEAFALSGYFRGARDAAQALTKMLIGRELGLAPGSAIRAIYISEDGRVGLYAETMAALVRRHPRYDYRVPEHTNEACRVAIIDRATGEVMGEVRWTLEEARAAGLLRKANWVKYPRPMLFARALTEAVRVHAPDAFAAVPILAAEDPWDEITPGGNDEEPLVLAEAIAAAPPPRASGKPAVAAVDAKLAAIATTSDATTTVAPIAPTPTLAIAPALAIDRPAPIAGANDPLSVEEATAFLGGRADLADAIRAAGDDGVLEARVVAELHNVALGRLKKHADALRAWRECGVRPSPDARVTGLKAREFLARIKMDRGS